MLQLELRNLRKLTLYGVFLSLTYNSLDRDLCLTLCHFDRVVGVCNLALPRDVCFWFFSDDHCPSSSPARAPSPPANVAINFVRKKEGWVGELPSHHECREGEDSYAA